MKGINLYLAGEATGWKRKPFGKSNNISFSVTALYPVHLVLKNANVCNVHSSLKNQLFSDYCY